MYMCLYMCLYMYLYMYVYLWYLRCLRYSTDDAIVDDEPIRGLVSSNHANIWTGLDWTGINWIHWMYRIGMYCRRRLIFMHSFTHLQPF